MAGNSKRAGAVRKSGSKKGAQVGTGGHSRKALQGKGPTPKAEDRTYHPAHERKLAAERRVAAGRRPGGRAVRKDGSATEVVTGRNAVLEALRAEMPVEGIYLATHLDADDRTQEILEIAHTRSLPMFEASRLDLDKITDGAVHQGVAMKVPPYDYKDTEDLLDAAAEAGSRR